MTYPPPQEPEREQRISLLTFGAVVLSLLSFFLSFLAGIPAIILANLALWQMHRHPDRYFGAWHARRSIMLAIVGSIISGLVIAVLLPAAHTSHGHLAPRSSCAANVKGIMTSMAIYGNENNDHLPLGAPPEELFTYSNQLAVNSGQTSAVEALNFMQSPKMAGYVHSPLWMLVLTQQVSPRLFICKQDPFVDPDIQKAALDKNSKGEYFASVSKKNKISYSIAYPWAKNPETGKIESAQYWRNTTDSSLPLMSDMAPLAGTGKPARDPTLAEGKTPNNKAANSLNHDGEGLNVGFADAHAEWTRAVKVGQSNDNIFTSGNPQPGVLGGIEGSDAKPPRPGHIEPITTTSSPWDIVMVPLRDGKTGEIK